MTLPEQGEAGMSDLTKEDLQTLERPPTGLEWWNADGPINKLMNAGLLICKTRSQYIPAYTINYADFELTEKGEMALAQHKAADPAALEQNRSTT